jgi:hypothetical protein
MPRLCLLFLLFLWQKDLDVGLDCLQWLCWDWNVRRSVHLRDDSDVDRRIAQVDLALFRYASLNPGT